MQLYHLMPEIISFFLLIILWLFHICEKDIYESNGGASKLLSVIYVISTLACLCNIFVCFQIIYNLKLSRALLIFLNSLWFFLSVLQCTLLLKYLVEIIYSKTPRVYLLNKYTIFIYILNGINILLLIINLFFPIIFEITKEDLKYQRKSLSFLLPVITLVCLGVSQYIIYRERKGQNHQFVKLSIYYPPITVAFLITQFINRDFQLSGTIAFVIILFLTVHLSTNFLLLDKLTRLGNRLVFENSLTHHFSTHDDFSIILVKVRSIKSFQDNFGNDSTDEILLAIANCLQQIPIKIQIYKTDNDEFMIIGPQIDSKECNYLTQEIMKIFEYKWIISSVPVKLYVDIFVLACPSVATNIKEALYLLEFTSKNLSINKPSMLSLTNTDNVSIIICDVKMKAFINRERYVYNELRRACVNNSFEYFFQPIYKTDGTYVHTAECLLRLYDKTHLSYITPSEFIPIAEKKGLISIISNYVLNASCRLIKRAIDEDITVPTISVNFSARQFFDANLAYDVMQIVKKHDIPPRYIKIEITESFLIDNYEKVRAVMSELIAFGIGFYLDDFGSGLATIPNYINLPFECIKIDRSILLSAEKSLKTDYLLKAIIPCFLDMGCRVVFEGIEKEDNLSYVSSFGDVYVQGYYFSYAKSQFDYETMIGLKP